MYPVRRRSSSDPLGLEPGEGERGAQLVHPARARAGERRSDKEEQLVDKPLAKERACEGRTAFEEERLHAFGGQALQRFVQRARDELELRAFGERPPSEGEPAWLARGLHVAGVEPGRIGPHGAHPDSDGIRGGAELVHAAAALLPGHPAGLRDHDAPVQRNGRLVGDERAAGGDPGPPGLVLPPCAAAGLGRPGARRPLPPGAGVRNPGRPSSDWGPAHPRRRARLRRRRLRPRREACARSGRRARA